MTRAVSAVILGVALWLSGAIFAPASAAGGWLVALPDWRALAAALAAASLLVAWLPPRPLALLPLVGVLLPWMPFVDAGLVYAGPLVVLVWTAVIALGWGDVLASRVRACGCTTSANRATAAAFLIALASTSLVAWRIAPMRPGGDEPHYLIMTQSLMQDGDLRIENNHAQRDFAAYTETDINPQYLTRGKNNEIYPIHAPGLSALAIPAFAVAGYSGVVVFMLLVMAGASALVWRVAWLATGEIGAAWAGWAMVAASAMWVFQSFLVFPEAFGGAVVACGMWLVLRLDRGSRPGILAIVAVGTAVAMLPWLHTRFAALAAGLGLMIVLRLWPYGMRRIAWFLAPPIAAAAAWFAFFYVIYGTPSPLAPWGGGGGSSLSWIPTGLAGALFDQQFGLLPYAPSLIAGFVGLVAGTSAGWRRSTRLQVLLLLVIPYLAATTSYAMWWGGLSVPARLLTALLPLLAPAAAVTWQRARNPAVRTAMIAALGWTVFMTASLAFAERGAFAWNVRQYKAGLIFEWLVPLLQWTEALPAFFRADDALGRESLPLAPFYIVTLVWVAVIGAAIALVALAMSRFGTRRWRGLTAETIAPALTITALVCAVPVATMLSLRAQGADGAAPVRAQMAFLNRLAEGTATVVDLGSRRVVPATDRMAGMRVSMPPRRSGGENVALALGAVPAGTYRLSAEPSGQPGNVVIGRARMPIATLGDAPITIVLPVAAAGLEVRGAQDRVVTLEPVSVPARRSRQRAHRAARYGAVVAHFVDNRVYAERDAFWVRGARDAVVVLQGDPGVTTAQLEIRNGPVSNYLSVTGAGQPFSRPLVPGETLRLAVPLRADGSARLQIESASGFVPAEVEPGNGDRRFLGVYVRVK